MAYKTKCDSCGFEWKSKKTKIRKKVFQLKGRQVVLHYFMCPRCKRVYRVFIEGPKYKQYRLKVEKANDAIRIYIANNGISINDPKLENLYIQAEECKAVLEEYVENYNKMFSGTFAVNMNGVVEYRP